MVGPSQKPFPVHKAFLFDVSPFFRAALDGEFEEARNCAMTLPDDKEETFERFLAWLYFKDYRIPSWFVEEPDDFWEDIIDDHIFSDKIQAQAFQEAIIDKAFAAWNLCDLRPMSLIMVSKIYREAPETSPLRKLALSVYESIPPSWFLERQVVDDLETIPRFAAELVRKLAGIRRDVEERCTLAAEDFYEAPN